MHVLKLDMFGKDEHSENNKVARSRSNVVTKISIAKAIKILQSRGNEFL